MDRTERLRLGLVSALVVIPMAGILVTDTGTMKSSAATGALGPVGLAFATDALVIWWRDLVRNDASGER